MTNLGKVEDQIFKERQRKELEFKRRNKYRKQQEMREKEAANMFKVKKINTI